MRHPYSKGGFIVLLIIVGGFAAREIAAWWPHA